MAGDNGKPIDVSIEQAIEAARLHRDQLIQGAELLEQLSDNASDDDYAELQDQMDELAPEVSKLAWGHKYFSLLYPEKLDDFHSPDWQHFHILKLQQLPPGGDGRYICAGRFVSAAAEVGVRMNQFTASLNAVQGRLHKYWRVGTRGGDDGVSHWEMMKERNVIAIGWNQLGDLTWVEAKKESRKQLKEALKEVNPDQSSISVGQDCSQITQFIAGINEGDWVLASDGATVLGIGRVTGEYEHAPEFGFPHQRSVEWLSIEEWTMPVPEGLRSIVREIRRHDENIVEAEKKVHDSIESTVSGGTTTPTPPRPIRLQDIGGRIQSVLARKSQVILYGPPGTGKTYWAEKTAFDLAAISHFGKLHANLNEFEKHAISGEGEQSGCVRMCCFHPAYGYEDFLEGYRPSTVNGQVSFELRDGIFKKLCQDAAATPAKQFFLIVDEINRGDIPRVFGELLTTLERDKRGKRITLPVSQQVFTIPKNVLLIGTMNTADRSISLLDAALRRRFGFIELMPDGRVLKDSTVSGIPLRAWFEALNERIRQHVGRDSRNLQIGHSYLLQAGSPIKEIAVLRRAIRDDIIPLLEEYCYEDYTTLGKILGDGLVDTEKQEIRQDLLEAGRENELVDVLLTSFSDIQNTTAALTSDQSLGDEDDAFENADEDDLPGPPEGEN
ncbi:AAA family ATPase [Rhodopirellula sp. P2]|uniref:AAA family ATPase n=1 Tax=Rhodopirellula sp. P2 TaxID=2127060 RepID=UPI002367E330|nr:AAA family ATPase [Rhodopirellula sp. P2]WDQ14566.1 AAA family ATPase [Rhodopirellula sp. P2]